MPPLKPLDEAVASIDARTPIGSKLRSADWERVPLALKQRAQFSAGVTTASVLQIIQDRLSAQIKLQREQLANGKQATFDRSSFIDAVRDIARDNGLTPAREEDRGTVRDITSIPRLGLIYDMQNAQAAGFARHKLDTSEGALLLFPAYRLTESTAKEPRPQDWWERRWFEAGNSVGWIGASQTEFVALKTSPIWAALSRFGTPWPPFDWGSTRELEDVDRDTAIALGLIDDAWTPPDGAEGGEDFNQQLEASVRGLDDDLKKFLKEEFGDQVKFEGDTAKWNLNFTPKTTTVKEQNEPVRQPQNPPDGRRYETGPGRAVTDVIGRSAGAIQAEPDDAPARAQSAARQKAALEELYRARDTVVPPNSRRILGEGGEHIVEISESGDRVIKHTKGQFGFVLRPFAARRGGDYLHLDEATPREYVQRLHLHNEVFGDDSRVIGVSKAFSDDANLVVSQKLIRGDPPSEVELLAFMRDKGFQRVANKWLGDEHLEKFSSVWFDPKTGILVTDVKPDNFVKSASGQIDSVDTIVQHVPPGSRLSAALQQRGALSK